MGNHGKSMSFYFYLLFFLRAERSLEPQSYVKHVKVDVADGASPANAAGSSWDTEQVDVCALPHDRLFRWRISESK